MKFLTPQLAYLLTQRETRENLRALSKYIAFLAGTVVVYSVAFHGLMLLEGQSHSWITGFYWTLTVMSTLGFGDITFQSDLGRAFSIVVLISGIVLLLIMLPFAFIRFFYAPWLEAQLRLRAPREAAKDLSGHVVITHWDEIARGLIERLRHLGIPHCVLEPDPAVAAELHADGVNVVTGEIDSVDSYSAMRTGAARLVFTSLGDAANTNVTLTVRELYPDVPIASLADDNDSVDVLELAGANEVMPLRHRLGEQLANRVDVGTVRALVVGRFRDLLIAEFPVHNTQLAGRTIRDTRLRELTGISVVATWERGRLLPARPDSTLTSYSVAVVVGTEDQIAELDAMFAIYPPNEHPVLVLGGGKVGRAAARALREREISVHIIERDPTLRPYLETIADEVLIGDAADINVIKKAGIDQAPSVVLSTNDDSTNAFLAIYCRRLNPDTRIVSRINHERNLDAIHRAGADSVLSYDTLGIQSLLAILRGHDTFIIDEGVDLFVLPVPRSLIGINLGDSQIGARTGLNVIAVQSHDGVALTPGSATEFQADCELVMLGTPDQREAFVREFGG
jgi:voltage-gated potassium channel